MSTRWFRFYDEALNDPKVQRLDGDTFKAWINLLCLASQNGGRLPSIADVAFALRVTVDGALTVVERLLNATLLDKVSGGVDGYSYAPHGWAERQYKSDTSTDRVKRFRQRSKTVTETAPDTDTDTDKNPPTPLEGGGAEYAFFGKVIRLKPRDFTKWQRVYHAIPDIQAELGSLDDWLNSQPEEKRKDWFHRVSGSLSRKHQEWLAAKKTSGLREGGIGV